MVVLCLGLSAEIEGRAGRRRQLRGGRRQGRPRADGPAEARCWRPSSRSASRRCWCMIAGSALDLAWAHEQPGRRRDPAGLVPGRGRGRRAGRHPVRRRQPGRPPAGDVPAIDRRRARLQELRDEGPHLPLPRARRRCTRSATACRTRASPTATSPRPRRASPPANACASPPPSRTSARAPATRWCSSTSPTSRRRAPSRTTACAASIASTLGPGESRRVSFTSARAIWR